MNWTKFSRGVFLVNLLGIVYDSNAERILIGRRKNDPYLKQLSWCFPGGRPSYDDDLEFYLQKEIKKKTNLDVKVEKVVFAKTYPEKREFLSIYYQCKVKSGEEKAGEKFVELKWVKPEELQDYFTTSIHPRLVEYLKKLQQ